MEHIMKILFLVADKIIICGERLDFLIMYLGKYVLSEIYTLELTSFLQVSWARGKTFCIIKEMDGGVLG